MVDLTAHRPHVTQPISYGAAGCGIAFFDFEVVVLASVGSGFAYERLVLGFSGEWFPAFAIGYGSALVFVLLMKLQGLYRVPALLSFTNQCRRVAVAWGVLFALITSTLFLLKRGHDLSRGSMILFGISGLVLLLSWRIAVAAGLARALAKGQVIGSRVLVIGDLQQIRHVLVRNCLQQAAVAELARFELYDPCTQDGLSERDGRTVEAAIRMAQVELVDEIVLAIGWSDARKREAICDMLRAVPLRILLLPDEFVSSLGLRPVIDLGSVMAIEVEPAPISRTELIMKRALDVVASSLALVLATPLFAILYLAIKIESRGPAVFRQRRRGFSGREFVIYKFRTMIAVEDAKITQATRCDPRVTRVGRILRSTSLDELPQLLNVLSGDMSLVGPRPHAVAHDGEFRRTIANYAYRNHVKPGITGWAQVHGFRGETPRVELMKKRVDLDLWYINNWSVALDLRILVLTFVELARRRNAY